MGHYCFPKFVEAMLGWVHAVTKDRKDRSFLFVRRNRTRKLDAALLLMSRYNVNNSQRRNNAEYERVCQICAGAYESAGKYGTALGEKRTFLKMFHTRYLWSYQCTLGLDYLLTIGNEPNRISEVTVKLSKKGE
jgi:hypothetical protein